MSTQNGILSKFDSKKLWTVPSKDQYLPSYFKCLCDNYLKETNPRRVYPVECVGLQPNSVPPTWVIGSNLHVHLAGGVTGRLNANDSPYAVLGSEMAPLPLIDIKDEDLDHGVALKELIEIQRLHMGENFVPALLILGGMGMALHYEELSQLYDGVPLIMAYGLPVSGKSLAVQIAMSLIGETKSIGECTQAGMLKLASSRTLPFWWDDVSDFNTLEALTVQTFNQSQKQTAKLEKLNHPRSVPLMTMNPQCLYRKKKVDKEKISRVFTRIAVVPFERISEVQTLKKSLELKAALQPVLRRAVLSVGKLIELRDDFREMKEDPLFLSEISPVLECSALDMRTQLNFALLLYSVGKILDNVALKEHFAKVMSHFSDVIVPHLKSLLENDKSAQLEEYSQSEEELYLDLIHKIVAEASLQPDKGRSAVDAVEAAVRYMEDNPIFNAGHGCALTEENTAELDAFIMDGKSLETGAVGCVEYVANPVSLARHVMEDTPHCLLVGEGALKFAKKIGFPVLENPLELATEESYERSKGENYLGNAGLLNSATGLDTVGAVALDLTGKLASATSTGGLPKKMLGRVGDSPLVGCGGYANNIAAASTTGHGESIMKTVLAWNVVRNIEDGLSPMESCAKSVNQMVSSVQGVGGVIALNRNGEFGQGFSTEHMVWACVRAGIVRFGVEHDEEQSVPF